jgi:hypothetical protein
MVALLSSYVRGQFRATIAVNIIPARMLAIGFVEHLSLQLLPQQKKRIGKVTGMPLGGVCNVMPKSGQ